MLCRSINSMMSQSNEEIHMQLRIENYIKFPTVGHIYYEVPDKSVMDNAQQLIAELCHQKLSALYGCSSLGQERLNRELNNMAETETAFQYLLLKDIIDRSRTENAPVFSYDPGSLILFLLGATPVNPLPPHYRCVNCGYVEEATGIQDGYDLPPKPCPVCEKDLNRDGHNCSDALYWSGFRKRKRRPTLAVHIVESVLQDLQKVLNSKCSKLPSSEGIYQDIELQVSETVGKISQLSRMTGEAYQSCDVYDKSIWKGIAKDSLEELGGTESCDLPDGLPCTLDYYDDTIFGFVSAWAFCRGTFTDDSAPVYVMRDEIEAALRETGLSDSEAAFLAHRTAMGKEDPPIRVPPHIRDSMRSVIHVWSKASYISRMLCSYYLRWYEKHYPAAYKETDRAAKEVQK